MDEEKLGYLTAKVEALETDHKMTQKKVDDLADLVKDKFRTAEVLFKTLKYTGALILAIATFKWGDIGKHWTQLLAIFIGA